MNKLCSQPISSWRQELVWDISSQRALSRIALAHTPALQSDQRPSSQLTGCTSMGSWNILLKPMFLLTQVNKEEDLNISRAQSCLRSESIQLGSMGDSTNQQKFSQTQGGQTHSAHGPGKRGVPDNDFRYGVEDPPLFLAHESKMSRERCPVCLRGKQLSFEH